MDREEKLRAAKEKLKKFQKKKQGDEKAEISNNPSPRSTPKHDLVVEEDLPLFTFDSKSANENDFLGSSNVERSMTSSSTTVSDQIDQVLSNSVVNQLNNDGNDVNSESFLRLRIQQLETEKLEHVKQIQVLEGTVSTQEKDLSELKTQLESEKFNVAEEIKKNQSTLSSHVDTIQILVSEKAEFEANVKKLQAELAELSEENTLLKNNRNAGNTHRERTCACTDRVFLAEVERKSLSDKLSNLRDERDKLKIDSIDLKQEVLELKSKVEISEKKSVILAQQLQECVGKLELAEVNLSQLRAANNEAMEKNGEEKQDEKTENLSKIITEKDTEIQRLTTENEEHVKRTADLTAYIQQASHDREQIIQQYTSYSQQLAVQIEDLTKQLNEKVKENHAYAEREMNMVENVQRLETQLQNNSSRTSPERAVSQASEEELRLLRLKMTELDKKILELQLERDSLQERHQQEANDHKNVQDKCRSLEDKISELSTQLEMSKENDAMNSISHHENLVAASTSDKVAASRAMQQNLTLKKQIEEIEFALIQSANDKAKLMTELDEVKSKAKKTEDSEEDLKQQMQGLHEAIKERDRNLARMKEQVKYYVAFAEHSISNPKSQDKPQDSANEGHENFNEGHENFNDIIKELQDAKDEIQSLTSTNETLKKELDTMTNGLEHELENGGSNSMSSSSSSSNDESATEIIQINNNNTFEVNDEDTDDSLESPTKMPKEIALIKVEQKFSQAMQKIAELSAEKEQLEHLIVRLQDETDTVGEYITIYQHQRAKQKAQLQEKEHQLQAVARDREDLKEKLSQLQGLLTKYMSSTSEPIPVCEVAEEAVADVNEPNNAAGQIMNLLTEIGSNEMLHNPKYDEKFQPWFWEPSSGHVMTV